MFNPAIVAALVVQMFIGGVSRIAAAVVGYVITTGILVWGLSLYSAGDAIAFLGAPLSQPIFLAACLVWYGFDTWEFLAAHGVQGQGDVPETSDVTEEGSETQLAGN